MIVIIGLVILVAAVIAGVAGVLTNSGHAHATGHFAVFGYHVTGSTGTLFLYGIVVGAVGLAGLSLLLAGARRTSRRGRAARQDLRQSRRETAAVSQDRDDLLGQRDTAGAQAAGAVDDGTARNGTGPGHRAPGLAGRLFGRKPAAPQPQPQPLAADQARAEPLPAEVPAGRARARGLTRSESTRPPLGRPLVKEVTP
jgi:hypothetical protein